MTLRIARGAIAAALDAKGARCVVTKYAGNAAVRDIVTGQNFDPNDGEEGVVLIKARNAETSNLVFNTKRPLGSYLYTNGAIPETGGNGLTITEYNSNGFKVGTSSQINASGINFVAWSFVLEAEFIDVVIGNTIAPSAATIDHDLQVVPAAILGKRLSGAGDWFMYHKDMNGGDRPERHNLTLNSTAIAQSSTKWNNFVPTETQFQVGAGLLPSGSEGFLYILFAHNPEKKIFCGSLTPSGGFADVDVGFRPKVVLFKNEQYDAANVLGNFNIIDEERGWDNDTNAFLFLNTSGAEIVSSTWGEITDTGFTVNNFVNGERHPFIAIG